MQSEHVLSSHTGDRTRRGRVLTTTPARPSALDRLLLRALLRLSGAPRVRCILPDGETVQVAAGEPAATLRFRDRSTLYRFFRSPEMGFGEGYTDGDIELDGDLVTLLDAVYERPLAPWAERLLFRTGRTRKNSVRGSRDNIHQHYDLGNEFYRLWLDERMVYTCAYFPTPDTTLEEAQVAKMHHVCRKVALKAGERVVEAGCGWGALALHMARHYGVTVRAFNISHEQIVWAREHAAREGLADRVEFIEDDYRNITGTYDCFMSVGMLEHVGVDHYRDLGAVIDRTLPAHGRGLVHTIGRNRPMPFSPWMEKYIFPGACPPSLGQMMDIFEPNRLSVLDVENLRLHYERTMREWLARFDRNLDTISRRFGERFVRAWRLYLAGVMIAFRHGLAQLFQVSFARERFNGMPWTRAHVYPTTA
jgi:cyclopropane-fatty-acyl-phospholipid synthase